MFSYLTANVIYVSISYTDTFKATWVFLILTLMTINNQLGFFFFLSLLYLTNGMNNL